MNSQIVMWYDGRLTTSNDPECPDSEVQDQAIRCTVT